MAKGTGNMAVDDYMSTREVAEQWGMTMASVLRLCNLGRVAGCLLYTSLFPNRTQVCFGGPAFLFCIHEAQDVYKRQALPGKDFQV